MRKIFRQFSRLCSKVASHCRVVWIKTRYPHVIFGSGVQIGAGVEIQATDGGSICLGNNVAIKPGCVLIAKRGVLEIGDDTFVGWGSVLCANEQVVIGKDCLIAEHVSIRDQNHGMSVDGPFRLQPMETKPIVLGANVWLGAKVTVVAGVSIGNDCVVGANSVVTKEIEPGTVVAGIPAKAIKEIGRS